MKRLKVGINGFGRIGRAFARIALKKEDFDIVSINTRQTPSSMLAYLLKHDSIYRTYDRQISYDQESINIEGKRIRVTQITDPAQISWDGVDVVIEATGAFTNRENAKKHLKGTVKKVIITAPSEDEGTAHLVVGANDRDFDFAGCDVISYCSCTTNCAAPMFKILDENFKIISGFLTTVHAYTSSQSLLDDANKTETRSRAAGLNIVPSTTGAAKAIIKILPNLAGKIDAMALRVPIATVSFSDISVTIEKLTTTEEVNQKFKDATDGYLRGIFGYETEKLVSSDYIGSPYAGVFDANYTKVINGNFIKIFGWYDNEWGYSTRLVDLVKKLSAYF